jgi:nucleotide-binding universal stress UspA family protein
MLSEKSDIKIRKILVGIDGSDYSIRALEFAFGLARKYESEIIAFTVFHIPEIYKIFQNKENYNAIAIENEIMNSRNLLKSIKELGDTKNVDIHTEFVNSNTTPDIAILEYSQENEVDHIVLGYRGRSIENLLIGNMANSIVSKSKCSVTVVK